MTLHKSNIYIIFPTTYIHIFPNRKVRQTVFDPIRASVWALSGGLTPNQIYHKKFVPQSFLKLKKDNFKKF